MTADYRVKYVNRAGDYDSEDEEAAPDRNNGADEQPKIASSQGFKSGPGPGHVLSGSADS